MLATIDDDDDDSIKTDFIMYYLLHSSTEFKFLIESIIDKA